MDVTAEARTVLLQLLRPLMNLMNGLAFVACCPRLAGPALRGSWTGLKHSGTPDGRHLTTAVAILVI